MAPRTKQQLDELKSNRKQSILDAAMKVFSKNGYHGATVSDIAREAGISKGLLYTYFPGKEELLDELLQYGLTRMSGYLTFIPPKGISNSKEFGEVIRKTINLYTQEQDFWRVYITIILQKEISARFEQMIAGAMQEYLGIFATYFKKKKVADPVTEAMLLGSILDGVMIGVALAPDMYPVDNVIKLIEKKFG